MKMIAVALVGLMTLFGITTEGPTSNCNIKPPDIIKTVPDPVFLPPMIGYNGKRAVPNVGEPTIPINKMQIGC